MVTDYVFLKILYGLSKDIEKTSEFLIKIYAGIMLLRIFRRYIYELCRNQYIHKSNSPWIMDDNRVKLKNVFESLGSSTFPGLIVHSLAGLSEYP